MKTIVCAISILMLQSLCAWSGQLTALDEELNKAWPNNRTINIVFHGHSVPSGYHAAGVVKPFESYPHLFRVMLKERYPNAVINVLTTSIGGEAAIAGAARFDEDVYAQQPDLIFIDYAINDRWKDPVELEVAWRSMIDSAQAAGVPVILITPTGVDGEDLSDPAGLLRQRADLVRYLAQSERTLLAEVSGAWLAELASGTPEGDLLSQGNHPNLAGHTVAADEIFSTFVDATEVPASNTSVSLFFSNFDDNSGAAVLAAGADNTSGSSSVSVSWDTHPAVSSVSGLTAVSTGDSGTASGFIQLYNGTAAYANSHNVFIGRNHNMDSDRSTTKRGYSLSFTLDQTRDLSTLAIESGHATASAADQLYSSTLVYTLSGGTLGSPVTASSVQDYSEAPAYHFVEFDLTGTTLGPGSYTLEVYQTQMADGGAYAIFNGIALDAMNALPVAGAKLIGVLEDQPATLAESELISLATDADGDALSITDVDAASANGAVVSVDSGIITYTPVGGFVGMDAFDYILNDGNGGTATGTVQVAVVADDASYNQIQLPEITSSTITFTYQGIPSDPYALEQTTNLAPPIIWTPLWTNWADSSGLLSATNATSGPQGFFRIRSVE